MSTQLLHTIMFLYKYRITATTLYICSQSATETTINDYKGSCHGTANLSSNKTFNPNPIKPWPWRYDNQNVMIKGWGGYNGGFISITPYTSLSVLEEMDWV